MSNIEDNLSEEDLRDIREQTDPQILKDQIDMMQMYASGSGEAWARPG